MCLRVPTRTIRKQLAEEFGTDGRYIAALIKECNQEAIEFGAPKRDARRADSVRFYRNVQRLALGIVVETEDGIFGKPDLGNAIAAQREIDKLQGNGEPESHIVDMGDPTIDAMLNRYVERVKAGEDIPGCDLSYPCD